MIYVVLRDFVYGAVPYKRGAHIVDPQWKPKNKKAMLDSMFIAIFDNSPSQPGFKAEVERKVQKHGSPR